MCTLLLKNTHKKVLEIENGYRDWSYAEDIVNAIILTMKQNNSSEYIINSGKLLTTSQVARKACKLLNKNINIKTINSKNDNLKIEGKNSKLRMIGFKNKFSIDDIIIRLSKKYL